MATSTLDLDGDERLDSAIARNVFFGVGDGTFAEPVPRRVAARGG